MRKHRKLLIATVAAAAIAGTGVTGASASPAAPRAVSGTEYIQIMSTASGPASAIARGMFTAAGHARLGDARVGTITFGGGTIVLSHHVGHGSSQFDPKGCLSVVSQSGTYQIVRGTGRYAGISGHGTYQLSVEIVGARVRGDCSSATPPLAQQELLRLAGSVRR